MAPNLTFFETAAQLFPLLFITLIVERSLPAGRTRETVTPSALEQVVNVAGYVVVILVFVLGEFVALRVLARGSPEAGDEGLVAGALGACAAFLVIPILFRFAAEQPPLARKLVLWLIAAGICALLALAIVDVF